jgi:hypothetical protein
MAVNNEGIHREYWNMAEPPKIWCWIGKKQAGQNITKLFENKMGLVEVSPNRPKTNMNWSKYNQTG